MSAEITKKEHKKNSIGWWEEVAIIDNNKVDLGRERLMKVEQAFAMGCQLSEVCFFADITLAQLKYYFQINPDFYERTKLLRQAPVFKARAKVIDSMGESVSTAMWFLSKKNKAEFGDVQPIIPTQNNNFYNIENINNVLDDDFCELNAEEEAILKVDVIELDGNN